jgi:hypothetical protein
VASGQPRFRRDHMLPNGRVQMMTLRTLILRFALTTAVVGFALIESPQSASAGTSTDDNRHLLARLECQQLPEGHGLGLGVASILGGTSKRSRWKRMWRISREHAAALA